MNNFKNWRKRQHLREVLLGPFLAKTAAESHRLLVKVYGDDALAKTRSFLNGFNASHPRQSIISMAPR